MDFESAGYTTTIVATVNGMEADDSAGEGSYSGDAADSGSDDVAEGDDAQ